MENKEVMEYKNIRFELREDFEDERKTFELVHFRRFGERTSTINTSVLNTYNVYVDDEFKAIFINGGSVKNVFECSDEERFGRIFVREEKDKEKDEETKDEELFEGIYRFMNNWKERKVEVFGKVVGKESREHYGIDDEKDFLYLLMDKDERDKYYKWVDKLINYGVKEGEESKFLFFELCNYVEKDLGVREKGGVIKGAFKDNENFLNKDRRIESQHDEVSLNYNDTLDFFEEIDEKVKASGQENTTVADDEKTLRGSEGGNLNSSIYKILSAMREGFEEGTRNDSMTSLCGTVISMVKFGIITSEDAQFIVLTTAKNCNPPMSEQEVVTCWNSITRKENQN